MSDPNSNEDIQAQFDEEEVRNLRKQFGWTRAQFALAVGVSTSTVEAWESGRRRVSVDVKRMSSRRVMKCIADEDRKVIFGEYSIKEVRKFLGRKVEEFADAVGVSVSAIRSYEKGARSPTAQTVSKIEELIRDRVAELESVDPPADPST